MSIPRLMHAVPRLMHAVEEILSCHLEASIDNLTGSRLKLFPNPAFARASR